MGSRIHILCKVVKTLFVLTLLTTGFCKVSPANDVVDIPILADSIYLAEGGSATRHPYGILKKYKTTTPRQACINTIKSNLKRYKASGSTEDFITFMSRSYCPIGAENDPTGLNRHWVKNVSFFYARFLSQKNGTLKKFNQSAVYKL